MRQTTSIKLDPTVKQEAQEIFATLGLTLGEAVNLFLNQVRLRKGIPFDIEIPNAKTQKILQEIREGKNVDTFSLDELKRANA
ncbi:type II toxin-antitoxin system RelB/DinJ family antitoxin [Sulfurospirillum multivorans]|uniref:RelB antitoxin n=2 Tax=Sulfurospirillum multivorans TaxID=66821 RepID=A0AA86DZH6_SULMK|nr:type II toxin-antitoxin system RelB/DinJ family antitoxin [Sulfurospirillum multivorans]AHJ14393.1 RelB antitoxin [Sulfurospirillum multivorans DSM 12446]QEH07878.1 RelB antitoxin [Sulfurospirillum multivorans]